MYFSLLCTSASNKKENVSTSQKKTKKVKSFTSLTMSCVIYSRNPCVCHKKMLTEQEQLQTTHSQPFSELSETWQQLKAG